MKSSDLKVVAIILSIALFFTIITSNAVSIASVVILAKGGTGSAPVQQQQSGGDSSQGGYTDNGQGGYVDNGTGTGDAGTGDAGTGTGDAGTGTGDAGTGTGTGTGDAGTGDAGTGNAGGNTGNAGGNTGNAGGNAGNAGGNTGNAGGNASSSKIDKEALAMFQKAAGDINSKGIAGYTKKSWQAIESINVGGNDAIKGLIEGFLTKEEDAEEKVSAKGSDDAKSRMPASNCSEKTIESVTKTTKGNNYVITIVMKDQVNPAKTDKDGLNVMSRDILYMEDVHDTVKNDGTVSKLVKSLNKGEINFKAYTITAEMTKDGKFVNITHKCSAALIADATLAFNIGLKGEGVLQFNVKYWDFKY